MATLAGLTLLTLPFYPLAGLSIRWVSAYAVAIILGFLLALWWYFYRYPGRNEFDWRVAETAFALALLFGLSQVLLPAQYLAASLSRPTIDPLLARADALAGIHVPTIVAWTRAQPYLPDLLVWAYGSFAWQLPLIPVLLGLGLRDRQALWEYVFHFYTCAIAVLPVFAFWPAACAFTYFGFDSILNQSRFIRHFAAVRAGNFEVLNFWDLEGLVSMPSFHVAGALMVVWALRRHRLFLYPFGILNVLLIVSTVATGAHYAVDLVGTFIMFGCSLFWYDRHGRKWTAFAQSRLSRVQPREETVV